MKVVLGALVVLTIVGLLATYAYSRLRSGGGVALPIVAAMSLVAFVPGDWLYVRIVATVAGLCIAIKLFQLGRQRVPEPAMLEGPARFFFWFFLPPDSRPPRSPDDAGRNRAAGRRRAGRGLFKGVGSLALLLAFHRVPAIADSPVLFTQWCMWLVYLAFSGLADVVSGAFMLTGNWIVESFHSPMLARSPREFWGRRWNMVIHRFAQRHLFLQVGGRHHPLRAMAIIFAASGAMHEYFIVAVKGGWSDYAGWMLAFFCLHGAAAIVQTLFERRTSIGRKRLPRWIAVALHFVWMSATAPLFITPLADLWTR